MSIKIAPSSGLFGGFLKSESGVTSIEYAIVAGGIALVIIVAVNATGQALTPKFEGVEVGLQN